MAPARQIEWCSPSSTKMKTNKFGEMVMDEMDICDLAMQGREPWRMTGVTVDPGLDLQHIIHCIQDPDQMITWTFPADETVSVPDYDALKQKQWFMPEEYKTLDIAEHVLNLCHTQDQLQRVGQELLLFQERGLFDLLRYLKYLVDTLRQHRVIWGVGRGSSVASYVLYLMGVHRIDSMYYDLDPHEFLR